MAIRDTIKDNLINYWDFYNEDFPLIDRAGNNNLENLVDISHWEFGTDGVAGGNSLAASGDDATKAQGESSESYISSDMHLMTNFWVRVPLTPPPATEFITLGSTSTSGTIFRVHLDSSEIRLRTGNGWVIGDDISNYADDSWHMVTAMFRQGLQRLWIDNVLIGSVTQTFTNSWNDFAFIGSSTTSRRLRCPVSQVMVARLEPDMGDIANWLWNNGDGRAYIDIAEGNFNGVAKFGSLPAKRVFAISKENWNGGISNSNVPVIESAAPNAEGEYEMRLPVGDAVYLQSHAFEPEDWRGIWKESTAYAVGEVVFSNGETDASSFVLVCTEAGTTGATEPSWPSIGSVADDGTAKWRVEGTISMLAPRTNYFVVPEAEE